MIRVRYLGPTNYRGARIKADDGHGNSVTIERDYAFTSDEQEEQAAHALARKLDCPHMPKLAGVYKYESYFTFRISLIRGVKGDDHDQSYLQH